jgi:hypothetical protein
VPGPISKPDPNQPKRKRGRPRGSGLWKDEFVEEALKFALLDRAGGTNESLAKHLGVSLRLVEQWISEKPEFSAALKKGKQGADVNVVRSLYERATGYEHKAVKMFLHRGKVIVQEYIERYPPDTAAAFIWLKNRQGWRDKPAEGGADDRLNEIVDLAWNGPARPASETTDGSETPKTDEPPDGGATAGAEDQAVRREGS